MSIIIGVDPGLINCAWGVIGSDNGNLQYIASATITTHSATPIAERLSKIHNNLLEAIKLYNSVEFAIEETFVNKNPISSLKLGQARGVAILSGGNAGLKVFEYPPRAIKKAVVGTGKADKKQIADMVKFLMPKADIKSEHEADALAIAICHANIIATQNRVETLKNAALQ